LWHSGAGEAWLEQVGWMIEHHPDSKLFREEYTLWVIPPGADAPIRAGLAAAWLRQVVHDAASPVLDNAFRAVVQSDFDAAESLLKRARRLHPDDPHWTEMLAGLYVSAVVPSWRHSHMAKPELVTPVIAQRVLRELAASKDGALLRQAGEIASLRENPSLRQVFGPSLAGDGWGRQLLERAQQFGAGGHDRSQPRATGPIRIGAPLLNAGYLLRKVEPKYPAKARIEGTVTIALLLRIDGTVEVLRVLSGHPLLTPAAQQAVSQWRYKPILLNGEPVSVLTDITVSFTLSRLPTPKD
jgi:TonB family protein